MFSNYLQNIGADLVLIEKYGGTAWSWPSLFKKAFCGESKSFQILKTGFQMFSNYFQSNGWGLGKIRQYGGGGNFTLVAFALRRTALNVRSTRSVSRGREESTLPGRDSWDGAKTKKFYVKDYHGQCCTFDQQ
jgi:hypothetical protein